MRGDGSTLDSKYIQGNNTYVIAHMHNYLTCREQQPEATIAPESPRLIDLESAANSMGITCVTLSHLFDLADAALNVAIARHFRPAPNYYQDKSPIFHNTCKMKCADIEILTTKPL